jgi:hypothetical protein
MMYYVLYVILGILWAIWLVNNRFNEFYNQTRSENEAQVDGIGVQGMRNGFAICAFVLAFTVWIIFVPVFWFTDDDIESE